MVLSSRDTWTQYYLVFSCSFDFCDSGVYLKEKVQEKIECDGNRIIQFRRDKKKYGRSQNDYRETQEW